MLVRAEILVEIDLQPEVGITFSEGLLVSLPCQYCQREYRTVSFKSIADGGVAQCFPGSAKEKKHPPYLGELIDFCTDEGKVLYCIEYDFTEFQDAKSLQIVSAKPTWASVSFEVSCPKCKKQTKASVQNNMTRPWTNICNCSYELYTERREMPILRWNNGSGLWRQVEERWGSETKACCDKPILSVLRKTNTGVIYSCSTCLTQME